jgi:hypothetical protein
MDPGPTRDISRSADGCESFEPFRRQDDERRCMYPEQGRSAEAAGRDDRVVDIGPGPVLHPEQWHLTASERRQILLTMLVEPTHDRQAEPHAATRAVGMQAASLSSYFDCKVAIYDAIGRGRDRRGRGWRRARRGSGAVAERGADRWPGDPREDLLTYPLLTKILRTAKFRIPKYLDAHVRPDIEIVQRRASRAAPEWSTL